MSNRTSGAIDMDEANQDNVRLSRAASSLWGKTDGGENRAWLPLFVHMSDAAFTGRMLWRQWVPAGTRATIARGMDVSDELAEKMVTLLAGLHDLGKASPIFQGRPLHYGGMTVENPFLSPIEQSGLTLPRGVFSRKQNAPRHEWYSAAFVQSYLSALGTGDKRVRLRAARSYAAIVALHHGLTPSTEPNSANIKKYSRLMALNDDAWESVRHELISFVERIAGISTYDYDSLLRITQSGSFGISVHAGVLVEGICIMADWLSSNGDLFPLLPMVPLTPAGRNLQHGRFCMDDIEGRAQDAFAEMDILPPWRGEATLGFGDVAAFAGRFQLPQGATPRPVQMDALSMALDAQQPGLMIIEAPMGEGKTEAALAVAEVFAMRSGCGGVAVALPTMATTDAMFGRIHRWLDCLPQAAGEEARTVYLAHGKACLNEEFQGIVARSRAVVRNGIEGIRASEDTSLSELISQRDEVVASDWLFGRKKGLLANFVVCTIDQVLMGALSMKHLALRDLGLANKVIVIDECHAYDAYMQVYLTRILEWLGSWNTPVVMLSATLPKGIRSMLLSAYRKGFEAASSAPALEGASEKQPAEHSYPLITQFDGTKVVYLPSKSSARGYAVALTCMDDALESLVELLSRLVICGGCVGVICNTVTRAQEAAGVLSEVFGDDVVLIHARFMDIDRMNREKWLREALGPGATRANGKRPHRLIVVGTQVLEQSLDIDFDVLVTDVAPVDLMLQRIGRMHRHLRGEDDRPRELREPRCFVRGVKDWEAGTPHFDGGVSCVYGGACLYESLAVLGLAGPDRQVRVRIPEDIAPLVGRAYVEEDAPGMPCDWLDSYLEAVKERTEQLETKRTRAEFCLVESSVGLIKNRDVLYEWCRKVGADRSDRHGARIHDVDWGPRAVRDTGESVEVILLCQDGGELRLLPWVGDVRLGVEAGAVVPTGVSPSYEKQRVIASSSVRLPMSLCAPDMIDDLIADLESRCGGLIGAWSDSSLLAGSLILVLGHAENGDHSTTLCGKTIGYSQQAGLKTSYSNSLFS